MGRDEGFQTADVAVGHFDDDKVRRLWRLVSPDKTAMLEATTVHLAVVLASWGSGRRKTVDESAPLWLEVSPETLPRLVEVGLLDSTGRIPQRSWRRHYDPAAARKAARVEAGRLGGIRSGEARSKPASSNALASPNPSGRQAGPSIPSESVRPSRGARASKDAAPRSPREILREAGGFAAELADRPASGGDR